MRISSNTIFDSNVASMTQAQSRLLQTQQQITTGRKILTAADDPVAAARALDLSQSDAINTQFATNRDSARHNLSMTETTLDGVTTLLQNVKTAAVTAGNGSLTVADRTSIATELSGRLQELLALANSTDGVGNYLFAGFQSRTQPFVDTPGGMGYFGDDGQRLIQVNSSRQMPSGNTGAEVFMRIKNGNGTFLTQAAATNTGTGVITSGSLGNPPPTAAQLGNSYQLKFTVVSGVPDVVTYDVTGTDATGAALPTVAQPALLPAAIPYVSGQAISFNGIQFDIEGVPANGDAFTVAPSKNESMFKTISDMISMLQAVPSGASVTNGLNSAMNHLDNALNNVLTVRASLGVRLNELDALQAEGENLGLEFRKSLALLQDVDYNKALSDLTMQQTALQAAQQTFAKVSGLSLFNYI
jgi:flagellar hook-associated protein 3 FlgL